MIYRNEFTFSQIHSFSYLGIMLLDTKYNSLLLVNASAGDRNY